MGEAKKGMGPLAMLAAALRYVAESVLFVLASIPTLPVAFVLAVVSPVGSRPFNAGWRIVEFMSAWGDDIDSRRRGPSHGEKRA